MKKHVPLGAAELWSRAEKRLNESSKKKGLPRTNEELRHLVQELEIHQIELEIVNEELELSRAEVEKGLDEFSNLYDFAPVVYLNVTRDGKICRINLTGALLLGIERSELINSRFEFFIAEASRKQFRALVQSVFDNKAQANCEIQIRKNGKESLSMHLDATPSRDGKECSIAMVDITVRKRSEEVVQESEARFRQLAEAALEGIAISEDGILIDGNGRLAAILGYDFSEMIGKPISMFIAPESLPVVLDHLRDNYEGRHEHFIIRKDRSIAPVESNARTISWKGKTVRVTAIIDLTERKRTELELVNLRKAVDASSEIIFMTDRDGLITFINPEFTRVYGYTSEEVINKTTPRIIHGGRTSSEEYELLWKEILSKRVVKKEILNKTKDARLLEVESSINPVLDDNGNIMGFLAIQRDITERKRSEEVLRRAQKMESVGTLAGGIAHDFNNLLHVVLGQIALAVGKLAPENIAIIHLAKAANAAEHATDLTRQLLAYSGKSIILDSVIDLNRLVRENVLMLETSIPRSAQLRFEFGTPSPHIRGDVGQIQQIVMNLIINAGEAIGPNPGHITIQTGHVELTENDTEYWNYTSSPLAPRVYASLLVEDTGCGMKPEQIERVFDPFYSTKFTGRGLGLAAVLGIIRGHHGGIRVHSTEGVGTRFEIVFPLVEAGEVIKENAAQLGPAIDGKGRVILVIDDDPSVLELLADVLTNSNFKVIVALTPQEGIDLYTKHQKSVAVVVLDYSMPGMDGKAAFEALININKEVKVLLCSGYAPEETAATFGDLLPAGFFQKPYKPSALLARLAEMISHDA